MLWIVITVSGFFNGEASFLHRLLECGVDVIHLRKPGATIDECSSLLDQMPADDCRRIVIHDYFELAGPYCLRGIHLNARRSEVPVGYSGHISRSCHSLEEVELYKGVCDYVFLSPIFDSVSKEGYASAFDNEILSKASDAGVIDNKVVALGGVTPDKLGYLRSLKFGGAAMLGCVNNLASLPENEQVKILLEMKKCVQDEHLSL